jgi:hypothetical protein
MNLKKPFLNQRGQSLIESLVLYPLVIGLLVLTIFVFQPIQTSIVSQRYVRAQLFQKTYNSCFYPNYRQANGQSSTRDIIAGGNQIIMGMNAKVIPPDTPLVTPVQPVTSIGLTSRQYQQPVHIRSTATLCTANFTSTVGDISGLHYDSNVCSPGQANYQQEPNP